MLYKEDDNKFPLIHPKVIATSEDINSISNYLDNIYYRRNDIDLLEFVDRFFTTNIVGMNRRFMESRFYIFDYVYPNTNKNKKEAYDLRPFVYVLDEMFLSNNRYLIKGINFNYLEQKHKIEIMEIYMNVFKRYMEYDISNIINKQSLIYTMDRELIDYFNKIILNLFYNIKDAVRQWDTERIVYKSVDFISPTHYNILPFYTGYLNTIKGEHWLEVSKNIILNRV